MRQAPCRRGSLTSICGIFLANDNSSLLRDVLSEFLAGNLPSDLFECHCQKRVHLLELIMSFACRDVTAQFFDGAADMVRRGSFSNQPSASKSVPTENTMLSRNDLASDG